MPGDLAILAVLAEQALERRDHYVLRAVLASIVRRVEEGVVDPADCSAWARIAVALLALHGDPTPMPADLCERLGVPAGTSSLDGAVAVMQRFLPIVTAEAEAWTRRAAGAEAFAAMERTDRAL